MRCSRAIQLHKDCPLHPLPAGLHTPDHSTARLNNEAKEVQWNLILFLPHIIV